jgi:hypothetical protein
MQPGRFLNNKEVEKGKKLHDELDVDFAAYNKHKLNLKHKLHKVGFNQLFWGREAEARSVVVNNVHGGKGRV